jgi:hypothetical protein
VLLVLVWW